MKVNFLLARCQNSIVKKIFGLCDDLPGKQSYIDDVRANRNKWIATVVNKAKYTVRFVAIDHCMIFSRINDKKVKRCDSALFYNSTVTFIELKERGGNRWLSKAEQQLKTTIGYFDATEDAIDYPIKRAYIANRLQPFFAVSNIRRIDEFFDDTSYVLRIQNTIVLE
jgi:hypothetical protein